MKLKLIALLIIPLSIVSCTISPQDIDYGYDGCHYCRMTVVDQQHAAQLVTKTGKAYHFDAAECLVMHLNEQPEAAEDGLVLVNHLEEPAVLIDATDATYLISEKLPSPMGANLNAFETLAGAEQAQGEFGGELFTWEALLAHFDN